MILKLLAATPLLAGALWLNACGNSTTSTDSQTNNLFNRQEQRVREILEITSANVPPEGLTGVYSVSNSDFDESPCKVLLRAGKDSPYRDNRPQVQVVVYGKKRTFEGSYFLGTDANFKRVSVAKRSGPFGLGPLADFVTIHINPEKQITEVDIGEDFNNNAVPKGTCVIIPEDSETAQ